MAESELWMMRPFNGLFLAILAGMLLILAAASVIVRRRSERTRARVISVACFVTLAGFFVYKYFLSIDRPYSEITAAMGGFNWWGELPLHLCNINMILIPIAVTRRNRPLMSFCFFVAPLGAMMALSMPGNGFDGYSLLLPRMLGYYGTHFLIVIEGLAIGTFGLYRPRFRDLPLSMITLFLICLAVFGVNMLLRHTGLHPKANYFYCVETEGNPLLEIFYRWIPCPFLYMLPCLGILGAYFALITSGFAVFDRVRGRKKEREE